MSLKYEPFSEQVMGVRLKRGKWGAEHAVVAGEEADAVVPPHGTHRLVTCCLSIASLARFSLPLSLARSPSLPACPIYTIHLHAVAGEEADAVVPPHGTILQILRFLFT